MQPPVSWRLLARAGLGGEAWAISEISPDADLDWSELTEPDELAEVIEQLGQAVAEGRIPGVAATSS